MAPNELGCVAVACVAHFVAGCGSDVSTPSSAAAGSGGGEACPVASGGALPDSALAAGPWEPGSIALQSGSVYWTAQATPGDDDGGVLVVPQAGGEASFLACGSSPSALAVDAGGVYLAADGDVSRIPIDGGAPDLLATGEGTISSIAVDDTNVYWTVRSTFGGEKAFGAVRKVSLDGGQVTTLAAEQNDPASILVRGAVLYWVNRGTAGNADGSIETGTPAGPSGVPLVSGLGSPAAVAVDDEGIYWTDSAGLSKRAPAMGGDDALLAAALSVPSDLKIDSVHVYWLDGADAARFIRKTPIEGGATVLFTPEDVNARALVLDDASVYWTDAGSQFDESGALMKTPK